MIVGLVQFLQVLRRVDNDHLLDLLALIGAVLVDQPLVVQFMDVPQIFLCVERIFFLILAFRKQKNFSS